ncbi:protein with role in RNA processing [Clydaea vesicula]|uniref:Protein with role in RNA processing n=1 Tax=Clydaea vesicula TaxID=447962 RepID=A0AAD5U6R7_9FUNG|nr:protein with role in RNA processing [Clydaea vesicula]KAJ3396479.1 protein with role in RNA processing [Lobulomyces angularis]
MNSIVHDDNASPIIGLKVKLITTSDIVYEGLVYAYEPTINLLVLQEIKLTSTSKKKQHNFHLLKLSFIKEILKSTSNNSENSNMKHELIPVTKVNEHIITKREHDALNKIGLNVSDQAQLIFDALSKTLPVKWKDDSILVLDEVLITDPYKVENCKVLIKKNNANNSQAFARVCKVLEGERKRLGL